MPNIIWLGNPFFANELKRPGINLYRLDCPVGKYLSWENIIQECPNPDLVVVGDKSLPPFVLGMEKFPCLTALYVVDSHIHSWLPHYSQAYDLVMVSLKDHIPAFYGEQMARKQQVSWMPPYCRHTIEPEQAAAHEKCWPLLFVGTVKAGINPDRVNWLNAFKKLEPRLHITSGNFLLLNQQANLVLNHSIGGDLNFRVFETLGSGVPLLSPRLAHGLTMLFNEDEDLFLFDQDDIAAAATKAAILLQKPDLLLRVAQNGYSKVTKQHLARHRADKLLSIFSDWINSGKAARLIEARLKNADKIRQEYLRLIYLLLASSLKDFPNLQGAYLAAAAKSD